MPTLSLVPRFERVEHLVVPAEVLCYGRDTTLLYTRQLVLGKLGCFLDTVTTAEAYQAHLVRQYLSVIILCQTLSLEERDEAIKAAERFQWQAHLLVLYKQFQITLVSGNAMVYYSQGSAAFVEHVFSLL